MTTKQHILEYREDFLATQIPLGDALTLAGLITALPWVVTVGTAAVYSALTSSALSEEAQLWLNHVGAYYFLSIPILFLIVFSFLLSLKLPAR